MCRSVSEQVAGLGWQHTAGTTHFLRGTCDALHRFMLKKCALGDPLKKRNTETRLEHSQNTIKDCKSTCHPRTKLAINIYIYIISHEMRTEATNQTLQERSSKGLLDGLFALDIVALERRHLDFSKAHTSLAEAS